MSRIAFAISLSLVIGSVGCASTEPLSPASNEANTASAEVGAAPELNAPFRDPALDVGAWSNRFEGESREVYRAREEIVRLLAIEAGQTVADVGTGTGLFVKYLADAVGPRGKVIATDISERFVAFVGERAERAGLTQVEVRLGTNEDAGLEAGSVDLAFVCDVYHHFESPMPMLASLFRALRPGGRLVILDFHRIPGKTSDFIMKHVRAGREVVLAEVERAGFVKLPDPPAPSSRRTTSSCSSAPEPDSPSLCVSRTTWGRKRMRRGRIARARSGLRRSLQAMLRRPCGLGYGATRSLAAVST